jgi:hypothetical protein
MMNETLQRGSGGSEGGVGQFLIGLAMSLVVLISVSHFSSETKACVRIA